MHESSHEPKFLHAYPNHNKPWIYLLMPSYQIGACIIQDDKPVPIWFFKLNDAQLKYTVGDKEILFNVMVLTKFRKFVLGATFQIHSNHHSITTNNTILNFVI